jgi:hypothetical protein
MAVMAAVMRCDIVFFESGKNRKMGGEWRVDGSAFVHSTN